MTLSFNGGIHEVIIYKEGQEFNKTNLPYFFNSIIATSVKFGNAYLGEIEVQLSPTITDAFKIIESGILGLGYSDAGQLPTTLSSSNTVSAVSLNDKLSSPKVITQDELLNSVNPVIAIRYLYPNQTDNDGTEASTPFFVGILNFPVINMTATEISITLKAGSTAILPSKIIATTSFSDVSIYDAIDTIIKPFGYQITFDEDDDETESILDSNYYKGTLSEPVMATVKSMLLSVDCYFQVISNNELRVRSRKSLSQSDIDFTFVMYRQIDPLNNIIPIYDFSTQTNGALFLPGGVFGGKQSGVDADSKEIKSTKIDDKSDKAKALTGNSSGLYRLPGDSGSGSSVNSSTGINQNNPKVELSGSQRPIIKRGTSSNAAEIDAKNLSDGTLGLVYHLVVPGLPKLRAIRLCQIIIGENLKGISGLGQIYSVTHRTGSDGWVSEIEFRRQPGLIAGAKIDARNVETAERESKSQAKRPIDIRGLV